MVLVSYFVAQKTLGSQAEAKILTKKGENISQHVPYLKAIDLPILCEQISEFWVWEPAHDQKLDRESCLFIVVVTLNLIIRLFLLIMQIGQHPHWLTIYLVPTEALFH